MQELTKEARKTLKSIYDEYVKRRKAEQGKAKAARFADGETSGFAGFSDVADELENAGFIQRNILGDFDLTDKAIRFMESLTPETVMKWLELGAKFVP